ncbi:MAG: NAD(P)H-hydrate dehydratase [Planctomycetes bacterium]|nr:NAD(P)H-hydrate dehydratase [Planctomycetota bacterium]
MEPFPVPRMPRRPRDAHKGSFGRVLAVAGSPSMTGAAVLCAEGAVRGGAGLVTLGVPARIHPWIASRALCWMTLPLPDSPDGSLAAGAAAPALAFLERCEAFALGPGLGPAPAAGEFVREAVEKATVPAVVDADGLNHLAGHLDVLRRARAPRVLTPHPGEFARLWGVSAKKVQEERRGAAKALARKTGAVVVLKGAGTVVCDGRRVYLNDTGNPGMASGGVGDVLTGVIAALLALGMEPMAAAALGVRVHGRAGDLAAAKVGETSLCAADVLEALGPAFLEAGEAHGG